MRQAGPPHFSKKAIFPCQFYMTTSIENATVEAVMSRIQRLLDPNSALQVVVMQEEVDEFLQCMSVMVHLAQSLYDWWVILERRYVQRKLEAYIAHLKPLCNQYNILITSKKRILSFEVPWSPHIPIAYMCVNPCTAAILERDPPAKKLAAYAVTPFCCKRDAMSLLADRCPHLVAPTPAAVIQAVRDQTIPLYIAFYESMGINIRQDHIRLLLVTSE